MASRTPLSETTHPVSSKSDLRLLLLGPRNVGKSTLGNRILGGAEFDTSVTTAVCEKRDGMVAGRQVTVVDTPGWLVPLTPDVSLELLKRELVYSACLCPPGPHCALLVLRTDMLFSVEVVGSILQHLDLLGESLFEHLLVVFSRGEQLGGRSIEEHVEESGEVLQFLLEECSHRYHVVSSVDSQGAEIPELLRKIDAMVRVHGGQHYEMDPEIQQAVAERRKGEEENAKARAMTVQKQRETLRSQMGDFPYLTDLRVVILGYSKSGKSSTGNTVLGKQEFDTASRTSLCVKRQGSVSGRLVTVVDTPGWFALDATNTSPELTRREVVSSVALCAPGPHAVLLLLRLDTSFSEEIRGAAQQHMELFEGEVWRHTVVVFTSTTGLGNSIIEQHIESSGEAVRWLVERCGNRYHHLKIRNPGDSSSQVSQLLEKVEEMVVGNGGRHFVMAPQRVWEIEERRRREEDGAREMLKKVQTQRDTLREKLGGDPCPQSELRIVLLGAKNAGKSSSANTILGRLEFDTARGTTQCATSRVVVAGLQVAVVDTPGWWSNFTLVESPAMTKREIALSVSQCPPGPHAFLLVVRMDKAFAEAAAGVAREHMEILGEHVWRHTAVLFTRGDCLQHSSLEQHIESEGGALKWLIEKCGNRYHSLSNSNSARSGSQVTGLLEKIEEMVAGNSGCCYEMDGEVVMELQERRRVEGERALERYKMVEKKRATVQSQMDKSFRTDLRLVLLGCRRAGKSSSANVILGREAFSGRTVECVKSQGAVRGRQVTVVDTPGWWASYSDTDSPELVRRHIMSSASLCPPPGPNCFLLAVRMDNAFTEDHRQAIVQHLECFGEAVWRHVLVLFTSAHCLGNTLYIEQHIESEGEALRWLVEKCGNRYHALNNITWSDGTEVEELLRKMEEMAVENDGCVYEMDHEKLQEVQVRRQVEEEKGEDRQVRVYKQTSVLRYVMGEVPQLPVLRLLLCSCRGSGKSSSGNTILGRHVFDNTLSTTLSASKQAEVANRLVTVIDTPGWPDDPKAEDPEAPTDTEAFFKAATTPPGPHAFLLTVQVDKAYTEAERQATQRQLEPLGEGVWRHAMVLFTCGDSLGSMAIEEHIESAGESLQWLVERCGNRYHVLDNEKKGDDAVGQITKLLERIEEVVAGNSGRNFEPGAMHDYVGVSQGDALQQTGLTEEKSEGTLEEFRKQLEDMELAQSKDTPPQMGKEDRSEISSEDSSGRGTLQSQSETSSHGSVMTSQSSGIHSLRSGTEADVESEAGVWEEQSVQSEDDTVGEEEWADGKTTEFNV